MPEIQKHIQLGKQGISDNFISTLKEYFKNSKIVRVSVLKNAGHDKKKVKKFSDEILDKLGKRYDARVIGFTIVVKKFRKSVR